jgi:hypothetical protein
MAVGDCMSNGNSMKADSSSDGTVSECDHKDTCNDWCYKPTQFGTTEVVNGQERIVRYQFEERKEEEYRAETVNDRECRAKRGERNCAEMRDEVAIERGYKSYKEEVFHQHLRNLKLREKGHGQGTHAQLGSDGLAQRLIKDGFDEWYTKWERSRLTSDNLAALDKANDDLRNLDALAEAAAKTTPMVSQAIFTSNIPSQSNTTVATSGLDASTQEGTKPVVATHARVPSSTQTARTGSRIPVSTLTHN